MQDVNLPPVVERALNSFLESARTALGDHLKAAVLYGSAAEGRLRATSDVNLIVVLSAFEPSRIDPLREPFRVAQAAIQLQCMFLLENEVQAAANVFAVKFADILHRRKVLLGSDPFDGVKISREAEIVRLKQVLMNLSLRLRNFYVSRSLREEQLSLTIADIAGPLRSAAASLLEIEGGERISPKDALEKMVALLRLDGAQEALKHLSEARETRRIGDGAAAPTMLKLMEIVNRMKARVDALA